MSDSEAGGGVPLIEPAFDSTLTSKKRKRGDETEVDAETKKALRKAKRKEKKRLKVKGTAIDEDDLDQELRVNHAFERMDNQLLADYINSRTRHYGKELSSVELEDRFIPGRAIRNTSSWTKPRTLENLAAFLHKQTKKLKPTPATPTGAPHTIIVTSSGIRAADAFRALRSGLPEQGMKNPSVAKLFAKHLKVDEQVAQLTRFKTDFGVGTPDRLSLLLDQKALSTANLKQIVIDVSYIDQKKRGILDMRELHEPLIKLLLRKEFMGEDKYGGNDLLLFY